MHTCCILLFGRKQGPGKTLEADVQALRCSVKACRKEKSCSTEEVEEKVDSINATSLGAQIILVCDKEPCLQQSPGQETSNQIILFRK